MSWLFSQALVAEYSADISLLGELSAPSSGHHTQLAFLSHGKTTGFSRLSRFGMMCRPLTDSRGEALLTSYLAAFRARTSAQLGGGQELMEPALVCGSKWPESSVRFDLVESKWKTAHCFWEEDLPWSSVTLPRWGMTRNGHVYQHPTAERPISATASGLWATPSATDGSRGGCITENMTGISLAQQINTPAKWPTPKSNDAEKCGKFDTTNPRNGLPAAVKNWPTPVTSMSKGSSPAALTRKDGQDRRNDRLDHAVMASDGGQLNPTWVEWLMGWPLGWTDLKPLAMDKFHEWQQQHSPYLQVDKAA